MMTTVAAVSDFVAYSGRVAFAGGTAVMGFPGIGIRFRYRGPAPILRFRAFSPHCAFDLRCNGWAPVTVRLPEGESEVPLPCGEGPTAGWDVELTRRNEAWQGVVVLESVQVEHGGALLPPAQAPERRLLCIGDSITGGERIERMPGLDDDSPRTANAGRSFGKLLGAQLGAEVHLVSYGGRGLMRDWQGNRDVANAPEFFERTLPDAAQPAWDHDRYTPDAVLLCLGTNDFSSGVPEVTSFVSAYGRFLSRIRQVHPKAALVLCESPVFPCSVPAGEPPKRVILRRMLEALLHDRRAAGDENVHLGPVGYYRGTARDAHPVAFQHEQIAADLLPVVRVATGW